MNRDFVYDHQDRPTVWSRASSTLNRWLWGALCCGVPGIPCYFCTCCEKLDESDRDRPRKQPRLVNAWFVLIAHTPLEEGSPHQKCCPPSAVRCPSCKESQHRHYQIRCPQHDPLNRDRTHSKSVS